MRTPAWNSPRTLSLLLVVTLAAWAGCGTEDVPRDAGRGERLVGFEIQGHRGARGLLPENSIAGAALALDLGADAIELDVVVSADSALIVSHDPYFDADLCDPRAAGYDERVPIYSLSAAEVQTVVCGGAPHPDFAYQRPSPAPRPTLADFVVATDAHAVATRRTKPHYTIEIKSSPGSDGILAPAPEAFADLVLAVIDRQGILDRSTVQSFDPRPIRYFGEQVRRPRLAALTLLPTSPERLRARFGPNVSVYAPHHLGLTKATVAAYHRAGLKVVPWTVNDISRMRTLIDWGVNGIITDYPDRLAKVVEGQ